MYIIEGIVKEIEWQNYSPNRQAGKLRVKIEDENKRYYLKLPAIIPIGIDDIVKVEYDADGNLKRLNIEKKKFTYINIF